MNPLVQRVAIGSDIHTAEWLVSTRAGQAILASTHSSDCRPRCMCVPDGVEMYVGRRGHVYYLSRMPSSGFLHAEGCDSVEDSTILSGANAYPPRAIVEYPDGSLCVATNLDRRDRQDPPLTEVSIDGLLDLMVEQADLNRLAASDESRTWATVRERLGEAATLVRLGNTSLTSSLYLPDRYSRERSAEVLAECEGFLKSEAGHAIICAPLKEVRTTTYSWQIVLKHLPGLRLWVSKEVAEDLESRWRMPYFSNPPRFAICLLIAKPGRRVGNYTVTNMACLPTDSNFLPCRSEREASVADELIRAGHPLLRPLRFDSDPSNVLADFAILDGDSPVPVFVLAPTGDDAMDSAKRSMVSLMQRNHAKVKVFVE